MSTTNKRLQLEEMEDRAWKIAQLAATLATRYTSEFKPEGGAPGKQFGTDYYQGGEADPRFDEFYQCLINRAEDLLDRASGKLGYVFAFELFFPGRSYSLNEASGIFTQVKWPKLKDRKTVEKLINDIQTSIKTEMNKGLAYAISLNKKGDMTAEELKEEKALTAARLKMFDDLFTTAPRQGCENTKVFELHSIMQYAADSYELNDSVKIERYKLAEVISKFG